jgi:hypothetical protein
MEILVVAVAVEAAVVAVTVAGVAIWPDLAIRAVDETSRSSV